MSYPQQLKAMATRLSNYSSTIRKVSPQGKDDGYVAGDVARFLLPSNTMVDFRTLTMHFTGSTKAADNKGAVLFPSLTTSLIDQIVVSAGGIQIEATPRQWGQLAKMLDDFTAGTEKRRARTLLNNERMAALDPKTGDFFSIANWDKGITDDNDLNLVDAFPTLAPGNRETNRRFAIDEWPGCFLGTVNPSVISTALTGDIMLEFRFAPNSILASVGVGGEKVTATNDAPALDADGDTTMREADDQAVGFGELGTIGAVDATELNKPSSPSYVLDDLHLSVKTIDISDGQFYEWLKAEVTAEPLAMPFQHFVVQPGQTTAVGSAAQTTRMTVNSSSVDYLLGTFVPADFEDGTLLPKAERAYNMTKPKRKYYNIPKTYLAQGTYGNTQTSRYFQRGGIDIMSDTPFESSFSVNNVLLDYPCDLATVWCKAKDEFNLGKTQGTNMNPRLQKLAHFAQGFFVVPQRLNFNTGEADNSRILSGLDSRNASVSIQWKTTGTLEKCVKVKANAADKDTYVDAMQVIPMLYAATTAVLRVSEGRVLDLVY